MLLFKTILLVASINKFDDVIFIVPVFVPSEMTKSSKNVPTPPTLISAKFSVPWALGNSKNKVFNSAMDGPPPPPVSSSKLLLLKIGFVSIGGLYTAPVVVI